MGLYHVLIQLVSMIIKIDSSVTTKIRSDYTNTFDIMLTIMEIYFLQSIQTDLYLLTYLMKNFFQKLICSTMTI